MKEASPEIIDKWTNADNAYFYENIPVEIMHKYAKKGGFDDCCDVEAIHDYLIDAEHILDLGAGYGRAIKYLSEHFPKAKLTALERSSSFCAYMQEQYHGLVDINQADLNKFIPKEKFNAILWLWANISDFAKEEHIAVLTKIISWLQPKGKLFLDILLDEFKPSHLDIEYPDNKNYVAVEDDLTIHGYVPTVHEIKEYAQILKLKIVKEIPFITQTNRHRVIFVLGR